MKTLINRFPQLSGSQTPSKKLENLENCVPIPDLWGVLQKAGNTGTLVVSQHWTPENVHQKDCMVPYGMGHPHGCLGQLSYFCPLPSP